MHVDETDGKSDALKLLPQISTCYLKVISHLFFCFLNTYNKSLLNESVGLREETYVHLIRSLKIDIATTNPWNGKRGDRLSNIEEIGFRHKTRVMTDFSKV